MLALTLLSVAVDFVWLCWPRCGLASNTGMGGGTKTPLREGLHVPSWHNSANDTARWRRRQKCLRGNRRVGSRASAQVMERPQANTPNPSHSPHANLIRTSCPFYSCWSDISFHPSAAVTSLRTSKNRPHAKEYPSPKAHRTSRCDDAPCQLAGPISAIDWMPLHCVVNHPYTAHTSFRFLTPKFFLPQGASQSLSDRMGQ